MTSVPDPCERRKNVRALVVTPTYNEAENLPALVEAVFEVASDVHILVVDDDDRLRRLLHRYLTENGFRVTTATDAADARASRVSCRASFSSHSASLGRAAPPTRSAATCTRPSGFSGVAPPTPNATLGHGYMTRTWVYGVFLRPTLRQLTKKPGEKRLRRKKQRRTPDFSCCCFDSSRVCCVFLLI